MSTTKERGILFSAPMVRALLDGRKTVTRRAVKGTALEWLEEFDPAYVANSDNGLCPYGKPGDRLWVRETWSDVNLHGAPGIAYRADDDVRDLMEDKSFLDEDRAFNYNDSRVQKYSFACWSEDLMSGVEGRWRPSIFMPRWASRILLEITDVRIERLNNIITQQCQAEGYPAEREAEARGSELDVWLWYRGLWEQINGPGSFGTHWVWVVEFKRVAQTNNLTNQD
jgi:hypothetical protein